VHPVRLKFDRVFDVAKDMPGGRKVTHFGFESPAIRQCSVVVPGWPRVESGMSVIALLKRPNDWHHIYGWVDLDRRTVVCDSPAGHFAITLLMLFSIAAISTKYDTPSIVELATIYVVFGGIALFFAVQSVVTFRAKRMLSRMLSAI
jgi:hypothetical protein